MPRQKIEDRSIRYVIGYTIKNDGLRNTLVEMFKKKFSDYTEVNQSAFKTAGNGDMPKNMKGVLMELCEKAEGEADQKFDVRDFVRLYYADKLSDRETDRIVECQVYGA